MSESFHLGGDPASIRNSARRWAAFSEAASAAASGIRSLDTVDFEGDEAETYKEQINSDLPKHLDTASTAWGVVAAALTSYAADLERHQREMGALATRAGNQRSTVNSYRTALRHSQRSDRNHHLSLLRARQDLRPGEDLPDDHYVSYTAGDQQRLNNATVALQATYDAASKVRGENAESVRRCRSEIDRAKGMRFAKPPGFWGSLGNAVCGWISDHAGVLLKISSVLKTISAVAGVLALIPALAPVMGPIALVAGGAALAIDVGVKLASGKGSWTGIAIDALTMVPGGKLLRLAGGTKLGALAVRGGKAVSNGIKDTRLVSTARYGLNAAKNRGAYEVGRFKAGVSNAFAPVSAHVPVLGMADTGMGQVMMMGSKRVNVPAVFAGKGAGKFTSGFKNYVHEVKIDGGKYPETASHVTDAQAGTIWRGDKYTAGAPKPDVLTIDRSGAGNRRSAWRKAQPDVEPRTGFDRDEYPPAMFAEGGSDASLKYISPKDNRGAGSAMGWQMRSAGLPNGASVRIVVPWCVLKAASSLRVEVPSG